MIETSEVKLHFLDYWRVVRVRAGLITLVFLLVMITAGVTTYFLPRQYLAKVSMEVSPDNNKPLDVFGASPVRTYDPAFVATQFEILRKSKILYPVIEQLDLIKEYSGDGPKMSLQQVFNMLNGALVLEEKRNTGIIEIGVYNQDPALAAKIANRIAGVYRESRMTILQEKLGRALEQFDTAVSDQQKKVIADQTKAMQLLQDLGIVDNDPQNPTSPITTPERSEASIEAVVNEKRNEVDKLKTQLAEVEELKPEALMEALRILNIDDATVSKTVPLLQDGIVEEKKWLSSGLGENHPRIKEIRTMLEQYRQILSEALKGIRNSQALKLKLAGSELETSQGSLLKSTGQAAEFKQKTHEYVDAKTKYLEDKRVLDSLNLQLSTERMKRSIDIDPAQIWQLAEPPTSPSKPNVPGYLTLAALVGLVMGFGLAFFIEYLDTSVKTIDDVERFLQIPVLAVIPRGVPILMRVKGEHPDAEPYRILRANIEFNKPTPDAKTITLISGGPGEGKSTTLNNLAFTCAKGGYNVLVVDADVRRPSQHILFETDNEQGLSDYLSGTKTIDAITRTTKIDNLSFISSGKFPSDNVGLLNSQRMTDLIHRVKTQYDLVFFDSPPILVVSDGSVLTSEMDMTVMVVQHRRFPRAMLQRVKQAVNQVGGALIGVVLNNVDKKHDDGYAYYGAYNDYYSIPQRRDGRPAPGGAAPAAGAAVAPRKAVAVTPVTPQSDDEY